MLGANGNPFKAGVAGSPPLSGRNLMTSPATPSIPRSRLICFVLLAGAGLAWDLYTKQAVFTALGYPHRPALHHPEQPGDWRATLFGGDVKFRLYTSFNRGALWGVGQGLTSVFAGLSIVAAGAIVYWLFWCEAARSWWLTVSLSSIMAGTLGNLYDRLGWHGCVDPVTQERYYAVRDFLHFRLGNYDWPVFNFADVFLVTGALMLMAFSFRGDDPADSGATATAEPKASGLENTAIPAPHQNARPGIAQEVGAAAGGAKPSKP